MYIRFILPALALAALAPGVTFAVEGEAPQPLPKSEDPAQKADGSTTTTKGESSEPLNSVCPMDGRKVDRKAGTVPVAVGTGAETKHFSMGFCSMTCCAAFTKDPAPALTSKLAPGPKTNFK